MISKPLPNQRPEECQDRQILNVKAPHQHLAPLYASLELPVRQPQKLLGSVRLHLLLFIAGTTNEGLGSTLGTKYVMKPLFPDLKLTLIQYESAYLEFNKKHHRQALELARSTRRCLALEEKLASERVREAELLVQFLLTKETEAQLRVQEADLQVGVVRDALKSQLCFEEHASIDPEDGFSSDEEDNHGQRIPTSLPCSKL